MKRKYLAITVYVLFLVVLFEGSARLVFHILGDKHTLMEHDLWWRQSWIARHESTGEEIFYQFDIYDPTKGWISKPNLHDVTVFENKILNTNSEGFRGTAEHAHETQDGIARILILGDSFTFGDEVSDDETYAHYLQELLPDAEIINLGVHGYGHDQMLIVLQETGIKYRPDIVILGFLPMDMSRNMLEFRDFAKPMFTLEDDELVLKGVPVPTPDEVLRWDWLRPRFIDVFSVLHHLSIKRLGLYSKEMDRKTAAILKKIAATADSIGAVPVFFFLPTPTAGDTSANPDLRTGEKYLFSVCSEISTAECFSARPHFADKLSQGTIFSTGSGGHWGPAGYQTVAEAIRDYLVKAGHMPGQNEVPTLP